MFSRRGFLSGLLGAACLPLARFFPAPQAPALSSAQVDYVDVDTTYSTPVLPGSRCLHTFGSRACGYTPQSWGEECGKAIEDCTRRGNVARFGGFSGVGRGDAR